MPHEAWHSKAGTKSHATSDTVVSPIPWYYASEMESMKKTVEQHSQDLAWVKSTLCGLQRKITEKVNGLVKCMEAMEGANAPASKQRDQEAVTHSSRVHHGLMVERLDTLSVSMTHLETRFEFLRSDTAAQLSTLSVELEHQRKELGAKELLPTDFDLQACIAKASSHVVHLERLHEKWTEMQAVQGSSTQQFREGVGEAVLQCTQNLLPSQELGALPRSADPSDPSTRTKGVCRGVLISSGNHFARKPGFVNSRIQRCESRIQEVAGRAPLPNWMQQIASLQPPENFHDLQPGGETPIAIATSTLDVAAMALPLYAGGAKTPAPEFSRPLSIRAI